MEQSQLPPEPTGPTGPTNGAGLQKFTFFRFLLSEILNALAPLGNLQDDKSPFSI